MTPLRTLIVEDRPADAELMIEYLRDAGFAVQARVVDTEADYLAALDAACDIILCDYRLPQFNGLRAFQLLQERKQNIPFILVSGSLGEELAVDAIRRGADDYLLKDRLSRLGVAVTQALERKQTKDTSAEHARQLATLISNLPGVVYRSRNDAEFTTEFVSDGIEELTGHPADDFRRHRRNYLRKVHADDRGRFRTAIAEAMRQGQSFEITYRISTATGAGKWVWEKGRGVCDASGHLQALEGFRADITERVQAEQAQREGAQRLQLATRAANIGLWDWQILDNTVWFSPEWKRQLGYGDDELANQFETWESRIHPEDKSIVQAQLHASLMDPWPRYRTEMRLRHKDGSYRWIFVDAELSRGADGKPSRLLGCHLDITERKRDEEKLRDSESKYRELVDQASDGIIVYGESKTIAFANASACALLGYGAGELTGCGIRETYTDWDAEGQAQRMEAAAAGRVLRYERVIRRKDGSTFPVEISLKRLDSGQFQAIFHDITSRRVQEQKIGRLTRLHQALSGINAAIVRIDNRGELLQEICRIAVEQGGFSVGWIGLLDPASGKLVRVAYAGLSAVAGPDGDSQDHSVEQVPEGLSKRALCEGQPAIDNAVEPAADATVIRRVARQAGQKSAIALPLLVEGVPAGILALYAPVGNFFDDELVKLLTGLAEDISLGLGFIFKEERLQYLAQYDPLTGLANRSLFFEKLAREMAGAAAAGRSVALLLVDLDRFRLINETLGRKAADSLIREVAQRIARTDGAHEIAARVGADSFALIVPGDWQSREAARAVELRIHRWFSQPFQFEHEELRVSATTGIAIFPADGDQPGLLFANAEAALGSAKSQNEKIHFYSTEMNKQVADLLRLENKLRRALDNGELVMWYQPKISATTGAITGLEALMRWQDPETGMVPPGAFIPLMEQTGLILDAGRWALSQVARDCQLWAADGIRLPRIAVNVSTHQLRQENFVDIVIGAAAQTEQAGSALDLEITESAIMENVEAIATKLRTICGHGVEVSIDDFGTGYSSLAYIATLPIHTLKIDRSFVSGLPDDNGNLAIVSSVISLAHSLNLQVIAEGVETEAQATLLGKLGCDQLQGYLYSRPLPRENVPQFLKQWTGRGNGAIQVVASSSEAS